MTIPDRAGPSPQSAAREPGWYWVREHHDSYFWLVAFCSVGETFWICGDDRAVVPVEIDERRITRAAPVADDVLTRAAKLHILADAAERSQPEGAVLSGWVIITDAQRREIVEAWAALTSKGHLRRTWDQMGIALAPILKRGES